MTLTVSLFKEQELKFIYVALVIKWHDTTTTTMPNYGKPHDQAIFQRVFNYKENWAHIRYKTNNNISLFNPFVQDANDSFYPYVAFVLCIII